MSIAITAIEKNGPVIICTTNDPKNRSYRVDFAEGKIYSYTGRVLGSSRTIINKIPCALTNENPLYAAIGAFVNDSGKGQIYYSVVESLLSYPELIRFGISSTFVTNIVCDCDGKLPKGYVAWCRKHTQQFCAASLDCFITEQKFAVWPQALRDTVQKFSDGIRFDLARNADYDKELCAALIRIANNSLKRYEIYDLSETLRNIISMLRNNPSLRSYLDDTKNARTAYQILEDTLHQERNKLILENEARIAALDGVTVNDVMIKVPSAMRDFKDEGEQQHNCVGYMYHDSMARGSQIIYFLRPISNPNKSYVTCRFHVGEGKTVEYRTANNYWFDDDALIKSIDELIRPLL